MNQTYEISFTLNFQIGDIFYFIDADKIKRFKVESIHPVIRCNYIIVSYLAVGSSMFFSEHEMFHSVQKAADKLNEYYSQS